MDEKRRKQLQRNATYLFWSRALSNVKIINSVLSLFYIARGLTPSQIIWVSLFWAATVLLWEVPSSYMADLWGRKYTLIFGALFGILQWIVLWNAEGFMMIALSMVCFGIWSASYSGTDIALLYDTKKELEEEDSALKSFGRYESAQNFLKIGTLLIGVFIAKDLTNDQFQTLLIIDIVATSIGMILLFGITEPNHRMDVVKQEAGVFTDAVQIIRRQPHMQRAILNKVIIFLVAYMIWTYYQHMYVSLGVTVIGVGIGWSIYNLLSFLGKRYIYLITRFDEVVALRNILIVYIILLCLIVIGVVLQLSPWLIFGLYVLSAVTMTLREPILQHYINQCSHSYNRATTLSLSNLLHNILEFPILLIGGVLVGFGFVYPYIFAVIVAILVLVFIPVRPIPSTVE